MPSVSKFMSSDVGHSADWVTLLLESVAILRSNSGDVILSPTNSTQYTLDKASDGCPDAYVIDVVSPVQSEIISRQYRKALLPATDATLRSQLYNEQLEMEGGKIMVAVSYAQRELNDLIVQRLVCGAYSGTDRAFALNLVAEGKS